ncbi:MAG: hypothetical protein IIW75_01620 [Bacteroidaceae bacterium]|nr:hypothetical protein [Bacteroidaceae bacterium]
MTIRRLTYRLGVLVAILSFMATSLSAQVAESRKEIMISTEISNDTLGIGSHDVYQPNINALDSAYNKISIATAGVVNDSIMVVNKKNSTTEGVRIRKPDPSTATWLALAFPGGGQIYNRKFWKLPIVYGGFVGCLYAYNWNGQMYKDYRQAYLDIMDSDPNTDSYKDFFRPGYDFEANKEYLQGVFKKRKDRYRRWRDLSIFSFIGVYALSVIDAYVDAQLSHFDISEDIHLSIEPEIINSRQMLDKDYYGLNLNISF